MGTRIPTSLCEKKNKIVFKPSIPHEINYDGKMMTTNFLTLSSSKHELEDGIKEALVCCPIVIKGLYTTKQEVMEAQFP